MKKYQLGDMENKFAELIWANEPVSSRELTELCEKEFDWKRTTTYTMLKRLCDRKIFVNDSGTVSALMKKEDFCAAQGEQLIDESFGGSLPSFIAAFAKRKKLSPDEIDEIQSMIDSYKGE